jgi:hypothetical protein
MDHTVSGGTLERTVKSVMSSKGFETVKYIDWKKRPERYGSELLLTNAHYDTIYGENGRSEFLLKSSRYNMNIRIECKWQQVNGSVDEKLPYLYLNIIESVPESDIIIIIDGGGWKEGAIPWLKEAIAQRKYMSRTNRKRIRVFSLAEFISWTNTTFR